VDHHPLYAHAVVSVLSMLRRTGHIYWKSSYIVRELISDYRDESATLTVRLMKLAFISSQK
jgi:hypothetical protein